MVQTNQLHIVVAQGFVHWNGKFLILKRSDKEIVNPGEWVVPGGKVEVGHSISETLIREINEETGLTDLGDPVYIGDEEFTRPDDIHVIVIRFLVEAKSGKAKFDPEDFTDLAWVDKENIEEFDKIIPQIKTKISELLESN